MISNGEPAQPGSTADSDGTHFALYSAGAERVELCLFSPDGQETGRHTLPECTADLWHGYLPGCQPGQRYGYRVHGQYAPAEGLRFNSHKLLLDPYSRALQGEFRWSPAVFDFVPEAAPNELLFNDLDSAAFVPKSVVIDPQALPPSNRPRIPWADSIIYEANVRGFTMQHPAIPPAERGRFRGMRNGQILEYLQALGITAIELMPVQEFIDEQFLRQRELRNFWGYNTVNFFTPARRYATGSGYMDARVEFREMVDAIHAAGIEVILDVAYNHTGESDQFGPSVCFRGIDNLGYYRTQPDNPGEYINDTGCGNTLNADNPVVQRLVIDSLRDWAQSMDIDGFRFDLATILGRSPAGFSSQHPLLLAITADPVLQDLKLIAEPWDPGPGGYQLGNFPPGWSEWNDAYRDTVRQFWRGDAGQAGALAERIHGSADSFDTAGRNPAASTNFITSHDGFTLADTVSYEQRHNELNGELNQDGHGHNCSSNYGVEGATADPAINALRRRQRLNMLATLLLSQGTPMLLAGDEFGNSQAGNNNGYAQDNAVSWLDWSGLVRDPEFAAQVRRLIQIRRASSLLRSTAYRHGHARNGDGWPDVAWRQPDGRDLVAADWQTVQALTMLLSRSDAELEQDAGRGAVAKERAFAILINRSAARLEFAVPVSSGVGNWKCLFRSDSDSSADNEVHLSTADGTYFISLSPAAIACLQLCN